MHASGVSYPVQEILYDYRLLNKVPDVWDVICRDVTEEYDAHYATFRTFHVLCGQGSLVHVHAKGFAKNPIGNVYTDGLNKVKFTISHLPLFDNTLINPPYNKGVPLTSFSFLVFLTDIPWRLYRVDPNSVAQTL